MARFKHTDNTQGQFMAVNLKEQLFPDPFERTVIYLINKMDMSLFETKYHNDETKAATYSPVVYSQDFSSIDQDLAQLGAKCAPVGCRTSLVG